MSAEAGCLDLGESRPQQLWEKAERLADLPIRWHLIGHLQRNKVNRTLPHVELLHSLDSSASLAGRGPLGGTAGRAAAGTGRSEYLGRSDQTRFCARARWLPRSRRRPRGPHVDVRGLMGMASRAGGLDQARQDFAALRQLRDELVERFPEGPALPELSMGMSGDYEVAIEEGATIIRVGSASVRRASSL